LGVDPGGLGPGTGYTGFLRGMDRMFLTGWTGSFGRWIGRFLGIGFFSDRMNMIFTAYNRGLVPKAGF